MAMVIYSKWARVYSNLYLMYTSMDNGIVRIVLGKLGSCNYY